jgi:hypothetical protein
LSAIQIFSLPRGTGRRGALVKEERKIVFTGKKLFGL